MKNVVISIFFLSLAFGQPNRQLSRISSVDDEFDKFTSVGQLGLTITNFGILGNGWNRMEDGSINPSCVYKQNTEVLRDQIEHFSYAGLWIGGLVNGQRRVSLQIIDMNGRIKEILFNGPINPGDQKYLWNANTYPSGGYFSRLSYGGKSITRKILLIK